MIVRIVIMTVLLVMIVVTARPCAQATSRFVTGFDDKGSAEPKPLPRPGTVHVPVVQPGLDQYERIGPGMTDAELKAAIDRAKAKATTAERGSGSTVGSGSGSAAGSGSAGSGLSESVPVPGDK